MVPQAKYADYRERDICTKLITPALLTAGWTQDQFREEVKLTAGRIVVRGNKATRLEVRDEEGGPKFADYMLYVNPQTPLASIEAKRNKYPSATGCSRGLVTPNASTRLITAKNIRMGILNRSLEEFVTEEVYETWMTRGFPMIGELHFTTEAPMGNVCEVDLSERFALAQRAIILHPFAACKSRFLMFAIMSQSVQLWIDRLVTGMTAKGIKAANLRLVGIPVAPLAEQKRIVAKVDRLLAQRVCVAEQLRDRQATTEHFLTATIHRILEVSQ